MIRSRALLLALTMSIGSAFPVRAQAWPAGSVGFDKAIYAKVYIGVGDALAPPYPIQGVRVVLVSASSDTVRMTTDAAGAAAAYVPRGRYRLLTLDWVGAGGKDYKWNMPLTVAPGMHDVELDADNAAPPAEPIVAESPGQIEMPKSEIAVPIPAAAPAAAEAGRRRVVDSSGFAWDVFEQRFSRGAVFGTALKLPATEVTLVFNRDAETRQLDDFPANWRTLSNEELAAWLAKARRVRP